MAGWLCLHRKLQQSTVWNLEPFSRGQAWVDLLLSANYQQGTLLFRGISVQIQRGQVGLSEETLALKWKWSRGKVRRFLIWLENEGQIVQQKTNVCSLLTIVNYESYQTGSTANGTADGTANGQQTVQQTDTTNKKEQVEQGEQSQKPRGKHTIPPTLDEVRSYCLERGNSIDPEAFIDHYQTVGWRYGNGVGKPIRDWQAAVRTWEKVSNGHTNHVNGKPNSTAKSTQKPLSFEAFAGLEQ